MAIPYSDFIKKCLDCAYQISGEYRNGFIGTEHILWAIIYEEGVFYKIMTDMSIDMEDMSRRLESAMDDCKNLSNERGPKTPRLQKIFALASKYASELFLDSVEEENLITAILDSGYGTALRVISLSVPDLKELRDRISEKYRDNNKSLKTTPLPIASGVSPVVLQYLSRPVYSPAVSMPPYKKTAAPDVPVSFFSRDLTSLAISDQFSSIFGREKEINDINLCLLKTKSNNPVIVGERGTGRTSIAEGTVVHLRMEGTGAIRNSVVLEITRNKIFQIFGDSNKEIEAKFRNFIKTCSFPKNILVLDSIMEIAGEERVTWNIVSFINDLKQMIEAQTIRAIMITTPEAYEKFYRKDPVLSVCSEKIDAKELDKKSVIEILKKEKDFLALHYDINISQIAIERTVDVADEFIKNSYFPSKAFHLLDEACALASIDKKRSLSNDYVEKAAARQSGVTIDKINRKNLCLKGMNEILKAKIIGQDEAIDRLCDRVRLFMAGLNNKNRPVGVFFFAGPTGVGKTELAKVVAQEIFGSEDKLFRFDMSEYSQPHELARLIGAPPGYVGYSEDGQLTGAVSKEPNCVVLLDEFEKANDKIFNLFLQVFDAGRLTDGKGNLVDFRNAMIIMTSNIGANLSVFSGDKNVEAKKKLIDVLKSRFSMEFINRLDDIILFNKLKDEDILKICRLLVDDWIDKIKQNSDISMTIGDDIIQFLCSESYDEQFGVRNMKRVIEDALIIPVSKKIVEGEIPSGAGLKAFLMNEQNIGFSVIQPKGDQLDSTALAK